MKLFVTSLVVVILSVNRPSVGLDQNHLPQATDSSEESPSAEALRGSYSSDPVFPVSFDAREQWPLCPSIGSVQDEGCCLSGYTIAPTSVMTDRSCIASNATKTTTFSAYHPLSCCTDCAYSKSLPCLGGDPMKTWRFWTTNGIASGGSYESSVGCLPYPFESSCFIPSCPSECQPGMNMKVIETVVKGASVYKVSSTVSDIQKEIFKHGPVQTTIQMFEDFVFFTGSGIYKHSTGVLLGEQHIKLIGWGHDYSLNQDFWIAVNSFGENWGNGGSFKIVSGSDHLGVESNVIAGLAKV